MKMKEYQNVMINIVLLAEDCIRTSVNINGGDANETERIPFVSNPSNSSNFVD